MRFFRRWREVWQLRHEGTLFHAVDMYNRGKEAWQEEMKIKDRMNALGLGRDIRIGHMLRLANDYKIKLDLGITAYDCRAILHKDHWAKPIDRTLPLEVFAFFLIPKSYDAITEFQGIDPKVELAIAKCLIAARTAGVI